MSRNRRTLLFEKKRCSNEEDMRALPDAVRHLNGRIVLVCLELVKANRALFSLVRLLLGLGQINLGQNEERPMPTHERVTVALYQTLFHQVLL